MTDDTTITEFAKNHRLDVAAVLVQIARDESAPAAARASAAERILAYSDGRPGQARQLTTADLASMSSDLRAELLHALLTYDDITLPARIKAQIVDEMLAQYQASLPAPQPNRFVRGPHAAGAATFARLQEPQGSLCSAKVSSPAPAATATPAAPAQRSWQWPRLCQCRVCESRDQGLKGQPESGQCCRPSSS